MIINEKNVHDENFPIYGTLYEHVHVLQGGGTSTSDKGRNQIPILPILPENYTNIYSNTMFCEAEMSSGCTNSAGIFSNSRKYSLPYTLMWAVPLPWPRPYLVLSSRFHSEIIAWNGFRTTSTTESKKGRPCTYVGHMSSTCTPNPNLT